MLFCVEKNLKSLNLQYLWSGVLLLDSISSVTVLAGELWTLFTLNHRVFCGLTVSSHNMRLWWLSPVSISQLLLTLLLTILLCLALELVPSGSVLEPLAGAPDQFAGNLEKCNAFLANCSNPFALQPNRFNSEEDKGAFLIKSSDRKTISLENHWVGETELSLQVFPVFSSDLCKFLVWMV